MNRNFFRQGRGRVSITATDIKNTMNIKYSHNFAQKLLFPGKYCSPRTNAGSKIRMQRIPRVPKNGIVKRKPAF
ncbi:MAG: hypothetical protein B7Z66_13875 [Chromatiales bacterium 21-64-14]|nr:MAG: hypothetical protein B7Z66_13875 [Chromatiales bacterium 21-64-14]